MYALVASNMILRGDGKANLHQGSCFGEGITEAVKKHKCNIGMLNPPYSQGDEALHELVFVKHMLDCLVEGGVGIAIVPMSCAISPHPLREEILTHHTLDAVMSMPTELFYPVGVVTCIMVFTGHTPHEKTNKKTWFGYWKDDGFIKTKMKGRIDLNSTWEEIRDNWVESYRDRDDVAGMSVKQKVNHENEWCAESYMETDYSIITQELFEETVKDYMIFKLKNEIS
jgi:type I restriction-modification system DNA methylase subunit